MGSNPFLTDYDGQLTFFEEILGLRGTFKR